MTLLATIEGTAFTEESLSLFAELTKLRPTDEGALVVIAAAAVILAQTSRTPYRLFELVDEFGEVTETIDRELKARGPSMRLVVCNRAPGAMA